VAIIETTQLGPNSKTLACEMDAGFGIKRMVATVSHELRTALNAIVRSISLVEHKCPEGSRDRVMSTA